MRCELPPKSGSWSSRRIFEFPYQVSATEPEVFLIIGEVTRSDVTWVAELSWVSGGRRGVTVIDDDGTPFRTAARSNATPYDFTRLRPASSQLRTRVFSGSKSGLLPATATVTG